MRVDLNQEAVDAYAERYEAGDIFPAIVVFYDGKAHWLADGFHRIAAIAKLAARTLGTSTHERWTDIACDVRAGTLSDAVRFAIGANKKNGLRRTNADKQMAVRAALAHPVMRELPDQVIADEAGVSRRMVYDARALQVGKLPTSTQPSKILTQTDALVAKRLGVDGKQYPVRQKAKPVPTPKKAAIRSGSNQRPVEATSTTAGAAVEPTIKHICPHCKGTGYING